MADFSLMMSQMERLRSPVDGESKKDKKEREKKVKAMQKAADKAAKAQAKAAKKKEKEDKKKRKGSSNALAKEEEFGGFGEVPSNMPKSASASNTPYLQVGPSGKKASLSIDGGYIGVVSPHKKGSASSAEFGSGYSVGSKTSTMGSKTGTGKGMRMFAAPATSFANLQHGDVTMHVKTLYEMCHNPDGSLPAKSMLPDGKMDNHLRFLIGGQSSLMTRFLPGKKPEEVKISFKMDTFQIHVEENKSKGNIALIDVGEIQEVRVGEPAFRCQEFQAATENGKAKSQMGNCLTIMHGELFRLKQLALVSRSPEEFAAWTEGLEQFMRSRASEHYTSDKLQNRWLKRSWQSITPQGADHITIREFKVWLQRVNLKLAAREMKDQFSAVDKYNEGKITFASFVDLYYELISDYEHTEHFEQFSTDASKQLMSKKDVVKFFKKENNQKISEEAVTNVMDMYGRNGKFTISNFIEFLHGNENELWVPERLNAVYEDMTRPLTHYFQASSHNTYLMGDQFRSQSSPEAYIRPLRDGCRCVEIDTWDGKDGEPIVYHGHTLTSRIKFAEVAPAIVEHGFVSSRYPIVLSMENHCSPPQQQFMARVFKSEFRDLLCTGPEDFPFEHGEEKYPSPNDLQYKVIIKHKKLSPGETEVVSRRDDDADADMSDALLNGFLKVQEIDGSWTKQYFVLTYNKLVSADNQDFEDEQKAEEAADDEDLVPALEQLSKDTELHYGEEWFHGELLDGTAKPNGRAIAEKRLRDHMRENPDLPADGMFMVRESTTFAGEFSLSFWRAGGAKIEHCRIRTNDQQNKFYITAQNSFINLFELVEYYKIEPLKSAAWVCSLGEPVSQPPEHLTQKWFHQHVSRNDAEDMLKKIRSDGAFLLRPSQTDSGLSISFRAENKIKHCRVKKEGRLYTIGDTEFDSVVELVKYYEDHPLYRKMKLRFAVDEVLIKQQEGYSAPEEEDIYNSDSLYHTPNFVGGGAAASATATAAAAAATAAAAAASCTVRAQYAYTAKQPDELGFPVDAIITNVEQRDGGWWQGSYGEKTGWFPSNYVQELDSQLLQEELGPEKEGNALGDLQKFEMSCEGIRFEFRPSQGDERLIMRILNGAGEMKDVSVDSHAIMREWSEAIDSARELYAAKDAEIEKHVKKMKIAPELSDLIHYYTSVKWKDWGTSATDNYQFMSSFGEKKAIQLCSKKAGQAANFVQYNIRNVARIYPRGTRVDSSNYDPQIMWNCGCQTVAMNYQTPDRPMWINHGKFRPNGRCGYVLKPALLLDSTKMFDPFSSASWEASVPFVTIKMKIISGRHIVKGGKGVASPFVSVEVSGVDSDASGNSKKTKSLQNNGFRPKWDEEIKLEVSMSELALVTFTVSDEDQFGDANAIGQAVFPIGTKEAPLIRSGYRSIQLKNIASNDQDMPSLLVHMDVKYGATKTSKAQVKLREQLKDLRDQRTEMQKLQTEALLNGEDISAMSGEFEALQRSIVALEKTEMELDA